MAVRWRAPVAVIQLSTKDPADTIDHLCPECLGYAAGRGSSCTYNHIMCRFGIFGGGISCKEINEIGGVQGIGKTQLGYNLAFDFFGCFINVPYHIANMRYRIKLAVNVQIPYDYGGLGGKAISDDMAEYSRMYQKGSHAFEVKKQLKDFLEIIFYFRVYTYTEQIALINCWDLTN
ncbi:hypothetical protein Tco_0635037 [Tanacetum coccineum]